MLKWLDVGSVLTWLPARGALSALASWPLVLVGGAASAAQSNTRKPGQHVAARRSRRQPSEVRGRIVEEAGGVPAEQTQQQLQARPQALDGAGHLDVSHAARGAAFFPAVRGRSDTPCAGIPCGRNGAC